MILASNYLCLSLPCNLSDLYPPPVTNGASVDRSINLQNKIKKRNYHNHAAITVGGEGKCDGCLIVSRTPNVGASPFEHDRQVRLEAGLSIGIFFLAYAPLFNNVVLPLSISFPGIYHCTTLGCMDGGMEGIMEGAPSEERRGREKRQGG